ncbi:MAG: UDP-glucose/GDP-mannose dehydrogenase family protein, partial [Phycisphaeraceae bacterium]|nr:UDP-glucose/GDP-mannose dehydrogenase family protein [Phycisphaeraceae bacterium]
MHITMVGTGYVGLVTGACFANSGNDVTCLDVDPKKIEKLNAGISPIYEPGLDELIRRNVKAGRLHFTTDKQAAYRGAQIVFICVGTPSDERGRANLQYVLQAARDIGDAIEAAPSSSGGGADERRAKIVVVKSTVPVGTNAKVQA